MDHALQQECVDFQAIVTGHLNLQPEHQHRMLGHQGRGPSGAEDTQQQSSPYMKPSNDEHPGPPFNQSTSGSRSGLP